MTRIIRKPNHIDVFGVRKDGGLDLVIVAAGALDGRAETRRLLLLKVDAYADVYLADSTPKTLGFDPAKRLDVVLVVPEAPSPAAKSLVAQAREKLRGRVPSARLVVQVHGV